MEVVRLIKFGNPTKFDKEPYGSIWEAQRDDGGFYIQLDKGLGANWMPLGAFLEVAFLKKLENREYLQEALEIYHAQRATTISES